MPSGKFFITLAAVTGMANTAPTQDPTPDVQTTGVNAQSCGMVTYSNRVGMPILKDGSCHSFNTQAELRQYNILKDCTCFFFYENDCGGKWIGWGGPTKGSTNKNGLKSYKCLNS